MLIVLWATIVLMIAMTMLTNPCLACVFTVQCATHAYSLTAMYAFHNGSHMFIVISHVIITVCTSFCINESSIMTPLSIWEN